MNKQKEKYNIICLSNQLWDYPLWTNKKHVMSRMSKLGHNVLFVDPPINTGFVFFKQIKLGKWPFLRLLFQTKKENGLTVFTPLNFAPFWETLSKLHVFRINQLANKLFKKNTKKNKTVLWIYHVEITELKNYVEGIDHDVLVYDCVDEYSAFPRYDTKEKKEKILEIERYLTKSSDLVFASAPGLVEKLSKENSNTHFTPNVGDYEKFVDAKNYKKRLPKEFSGLQRPIIGYTGAIDEYKFDKELMKKVAQDYPNYSFVLIGPKALKDREATKEELGFDGLDNIHFWGTKPYSEIHKYFGGFDVFIIPYQLSDYTVGGCFPVKFHDGLAVGLPVVVTDLPAYAPFTQECYVSKSYNEFSQNIRRALEEDNDKRVRERKKVAKENNWDGKVDKMLKLIRKVAK
jgi:hypothetical protein